MQVIADLPALLVQAVVQIVRVHPGTAWICLCQCHLDPANLGPVGIASVCHIKIAEAADDEVDVPALEILTQLIEKPLETGAIHRAVLLSRIAFALHPDKRDSLDGPTLDCAIDLGHESVIEITNGPGVLARGDGPVFVPPPNGLAAHGVLDHNDIGLAKGRFHSRDKREVWIEPSHVGLAREDEQVGPCILRQSSVEGLNGCDQTGQEAHQDCQYDLFHHVFLIPWVNAGSDHPAAKRFTSPYQCAASAQPSGRSCRAGRL